MHSWLELLFHYLMIQWIKMMAELREDRFSFSWLSREAEVRFLQEIVFAHRKVVSTFSGSTKVDSFSGRAVNPGRMWKSHILIGFLATFFFKSHSRKITLWFFRRSNEKVIKLFCRLLGRQWSAKWVSRGLYLRKLLSCGKYTPGIIEWDQELLKGF